MNIIVQKYGGSSVSDVKKLKNVCKHIIGEYNKGNKVVVVVSAQGKTTDKLINEEKQITLDANKREHDMLVTVGEQITIAKLAMMLDKEGYKAISYAGWQIPIITNNVHGNAIIEDINKNKIIENLDEGKIVIVAGFQGVTKDNEITTLGRGGSDTTAVALATVLRANRCDIYTDVDGIYSADPRIIKNITKINSISYDEMLELASLGAKVLHNRCVEIGKEYNIPIYVKSSFNNNIGTKVSDDILNINVNENFKNKYNKNNKSQIFQNQKLEHLNISGITGQKDICKIEYNINTNDNNISYELFKKITDNGIVLDMILQNRINEDNLILSFTISKEDIEKINKILKNDNNIILENNLSKVSIVGNGIMTNTKVLEEVCMILENENIKFHSIVTSEIKISILINEKDSDKLLKKLHERFFENKE